jgi:hypothetical protein
MLSLLQWSTANSKSNARTTNDDWRVAKKKGNKSRVTQNIYPLKDN